MKRIRREGKGMDKERQQSLNYEKKGRKKRQREEVKNQKTDDEEVRMTES